MYKKNEELQRIDKYFHTCISLDHSNGALPVVIGDRL